jgi:L-lactate dehydrogenase complex protein LldG
MTARDEILSRIRAALTDRPDPGPVPRDYRRAGAAGADGAGRTTDVERLVDRLRDYRATVHRCDSDVAESIDGILADRGIRQVVIPDGFPPAWYPTTPRIGEPIDTPTLETVNATITSCALAIADTGTIVLDAGPGMGRRALSLIPDYHLVVLGTEQIVAIVPDAIAALDPTRPLTWISGPSATSDIELRRVEGVHGPRTLDVLLVG